MINCEFFTIKEITWSGIVINFLKKVILESTAMAIAVTIFVPFITAIFSSIKTGNWLNYFKQIPDWGYNLFGIIIIAWFVLQVIYKRYKNLNNHFSLPIKTSSTWGDIPIAEFSYYGVIWVVLAPAPHPWLDSLLIKDINPDNVEVDLPPRCPKCKTKLDQKKTFLGFWSWYCVSCDFKTFKKDSFYIAENGATMIAQRQVEKIQEEQRNSLT